MNRLILLSFSVLLISCRITYQDVYGTYKLKNFPKTTLEVKVDNTFVFTQNYPNPYLHPIPHPDEYYFRTLGNWHALLGTIKLVGTADSMEYNSVKILSSVSSTNKHSNFTFVDEFGDTVPILGVQYCDSTWVSEMHRTMDDYDEDLTKRDTLQFNFFGYEPWTFIHGEQKNNNYTVELLPTFRPNKIDNVYLKLRKNSIGSKKLKFKKKKSM